MVVLVFLEKQVSNFRCQKQLLWVLLVLIMLLIIQMLRGLRDFLSSKCCIILTMLLTHLVVLMFTLPLCKPVLRREQAVLEVVVPLKQLSY